MSKWSSPIFRVLNQFWLCFVECNEKFRGSQLATKDTLPAYFGCEPILGGLATEGGEGEDFVATMDSGFETPGGF